MSAATSDGDDGRFLARGHSFLGLRGESTSGTLSYPELRAELGDRLSCSHKLFAFRAELLERAYRPIVTGFECVFDGFSAQHFAEHVGPEV